MSGQNENYENNNLTQGYGVERCWPKCIWTWVEFVRPKPKTYTKSTAF